MKYKSHIKKEINMIKTAQITTQLTAYISYLKESERSCATQTQYYRDIRRFLSWAGDAALAKETVIRYKEMLQAEYKAASVNAKLAAINSFFSFLGKNELRVRQLRIQRQAYCSNEKELAKNEYLRLVEAAKEQKDERLSLLLQTICSTGIRVSELQYITVEAIKLGEAAICMKGKNRTILIPGKLRKALWEYLQRQNITSGPIFITKNGNPLDRSNICKKMKALCSSAGVAAKKVFPHNLRHLFARCFYALEKDIAKLADVLGHSSINTTRIYIVSTGLEHRRQMDTLGLIL